MVKCRECGADNPESSRFCGNCGARLVIKCPSCGELVAPGNKFCPSCGARVVDVTAAAASSPPAYGVPPAPQRNAGVGTQSTSWPSSPPVGAPPPALGPVAPPPPASPGVSMAPSSGMTPPQWSDGAATLSGVSSSYQFGQQIYQYKGLGARFVAMLLDGLIVGLPSYLIMGALFSKQMSRLAYGDTSALTVPYLLMMGVSLAYTILLEAGGGTLGKRIMGMRIIDEQGNKPGIGKALIRNLLRLVDFLPFMYLLGAIVAGASDKKQRIGDKVAGTLVVAR